MCQALSAYDGHFDASPVFSHQKNLPTSLPHHNQLINEMASVGVFLSSL